MVQPTGIIEFIQKLGENGAVLSAAAHALQTPCKRKNNRENHQDLLLFVLQSPVFIEQS